MGKAVPGLAATSLEACQVLMNGTIATRSKVNECFYVNRDWEMVQRIFKS